MLRKLSIPIFTERLYGFTFPDAGKIYACDHDESFEITLGDSPSVEVLEDNPYEFIASFENAFGQSRRYANTPTWWGRSRLLV